ncbi:hypothetical protein [Cellulophaga omnivescoria]|uniref:hypothetical protein n=1 Tax=Cellulophaga omnivescoria TaxID=1888890 RepID=UPI0022F08849|nr:hypothetical protein [Cellulophaga omnivescoria]WBU89238.1 hypothetical protein PBN93_15370 [Cellulophaga omnivescoria]
MNNLLYEVKYAVETYFKFLQDNYNFTSFEQVPLAYEYHFKAKDNANNFINIHIELIASTPIWVNFNGVYIEDIISSDIVNAYNQELHNLYDKNFKKYLKTKDVAYISANVDNYNLYGKSINEKRLQCIAKIINKDFYALVEASNKVKQLKKRKDKEANKHIHSNTLNEFVLLSKSQKFKQNFKYNKTLSIDTEKCQIEVVSYTELEGVIKKILKSRINLQIRWFFVN